MADPFTPKFFDLVRNTVTTVGTGNFTLGPAVNGYSGIAQALQVGDGFYYSCIGIDKPAEREVGRGTLLAGGAVSRDPISGTKTNFTTGSKSIALIAAAKWFSSVQAGAGGASAGFAASRGALAAMADRQKPVVLAEAGREGLFVWNASDLSARVTADPAQGICVAPSTDPTGTSGAWLRSFTGAKDARWFGAVGDGIADDHVSLQAWLDSGGELLLPSARFRSSQKLLVRRNCHIRGEQPYGNDSRPAPVGYQYVPGSRIVFDAGVAGLDVQTSTTLATVADVNAAAASSFTQEGAFNSTIEDIGIVGMGGATADGITVRTLSHFRNVRVAQFSGRGWYLAGSTVTDAEPYGNLSNSSLVDCAAESNGSHGLHIFGHDANTCKITGFNATLNGGWGIYQEAFIGSVFDKPHLATNTLGAFKTASAATNTIIFPYVETGTGSNVDILDGNIVVGDLRTINVAGRLNATIGNAAIQAQSIQGVGPGVPLTADSTNSNSAKLALKDNGTLRSYVGSASGSGVDFAVFNADGNPALNIYSAGNARRFEIVGGLWGQTAAARLGVSSGVQLLYDAAAGGVIEGGGSAYDVSLRNKIGTTALRIPTGTTNAEVVGTISASNLSGTNSGDETGASVTAKLNAFSGDVTKAAGATALTITNNAVTYAKLQNAAASRLLGNPTGAAAAVAEIGLAGGLAFSGTNLTLGAITPAIVAEFNCWKWLIDSGTVWYVKCATVDAGIMPPDGVLM